ncbi:MAG: LCP family protein [Endomicrobiales bacterium]|nr:LCP family protein [Endomicrobiales bacterium]
MKKLFSSILKLKFDHIILFAIVFLVSISLYLSWKSPVAKALRDGRRINGLIIGTDWVDYARHSDTLIFVSYDPIRRFLDIISIPRDTKFSPQGYNFRRINEVYAYHFRTKKNHQIASREVCNSVESLLLNRVKIPLYMQINYSSFKKLIDLIGGLTIDIDEPMHYDDKAGKLHIHFETGKQHLDGEKALDYVRYRGRAGDVGRIFRQQRFIRAMLSSWKNLFFMWNLPKIIIIAVKEINTNLSLWDMLVIISELKEINVKNLRLSQLPGESKRGYWEPDIENCEGLMNTVLPQKDAIESKKSRIRIEVWNAAGVSKLAENVVWILRHHGYDVIDWGNFSVRQKKTIIKDLTGDLEAAQRISNILECGEVITRYDEKRFIDISVILGEDCKIITNTKTQN